MSRPATVPIAGFAVGLFGLLGLALGLAAAGLADAPRAGYRVVASYPHDPDAFTQGLVFIDGVLVEGTGLNGRSSLRRVELATGRVLQQVDLPAQWFGEGVTALGDELVQLTWRDGVGLRYDRASLTPIGEFPLAGEGWGLTHDGTHWILSDGSDILFWLDPRDGRELRRVRVHDGLRAVSRLNELEYIDGEVWANLWQRDEIARIDPASGQVLGYLDLAGLRPADARGPDAVLNGIAWDAATRRLFVTGKLWPRVYQIEPVAD